MDLDKPHKAKRVEPDYIEPWWTPIVFGAARFVAGAALGRDRVRPAHV